MNFKIKKRKLQKQKFKWNLYVNLNESVNLYEMKIKLHTCITQVAANLFSNYFYFNFFNLK